jgi:acetyl esterase/lipase/5'-deoxynucleotidase YfbR-like HD superfamily hydrolase
MSFRVTEKPIPDQTAAGVPDPRVLQLWLDGAKRPPSPPPQGLAEIRAGMGWPNLDLSTGVTTEASTLAGRHGPLGVRISQPQAGSRGLRPAVVYFHGGGFIGGSMKTVDNPCRLLAERAGAVVFNLDYRLAPEHPFPGPLEDCWDAVKAVYDRAAEFGIDPQRIAVAGDSAGGNLAAGCSLLSAREGLGRIAAQLLIYPVVDLRAEAAGHLAWSEAHYEVNAWPEFVWPAIRGLKGAAPFFNDNYLAGGDASDPLASPLVVPDYGAFPPTLVLTAEFDYLRVEGEEFAQRLAAAGVATRAVRYRGMDHAFFDKLGLFPQAADAVEEMARFLGAVTSAPADRRLDAQLAFLLEIDKLKLVVRRSELADASRRENTAEHSWHLVMFALTLVEHAAPGVDLAKVMRLCALHDLVEIDAGDTFFWDAKGYEDKEDRERAAAKRLFGLLPDGQGAEFEELWEEFEACVTPEAVYANAVDRLAPVLLNSHSGGRSWRENGITADKIRQKMTVIAQASPRLGQALETLIVAAAKSGALP